MAQFPQTKSDRTSRSPGKCSQVHRHCGITNSVFLFEAKWNHRTGIHQTILGVLPHSFQPTFFSNTSRFPWVSGGLLERRIPGKDGEGAPRYRVVCSPKTRLPGPRGLMGKIAKKKGQYIPLEPCTPPQSGARLRSQRRRRWRRRG